MSLFDGQTGESRRASDPNRIDNVSEDISTRLRDFDAVYQKRLSFPTRATNWVRPASWVVVMDARRPRPAVVEQWVGFGTETNPCKNRACAVPFCCPTMRAMKYGYARVSTDDQSFAALRDTTNAEGMRVRCRKR